MPLWASAPAPVPGMGRGQRWGRPVAANLAGRARGAPARAQRSSSGRRGKDPGAKAHGLRACALGSARSSRASSATNVSARACRMGILPLPARGLEVIGDLLQSALATFIGKVKIQKIACAAVRRWVRSAPGACVPP